MKNEFEYTIGMSYAEREHSKEGRREVCFTTIWCSNKGIRMIIPCPNMVANRTVLRKAFGAGGMLCMLLKLVSR